MMDRKIVNILLVEDNPDHAELTVKAFKDSDGLVNKIHVAVDGEEALEYLYNRGEYSSPGDYPRPDLVLLDIKLPKVNGFEVLRTIKTDDKLKAIPVVILTTSDSTSDKVKAYSEGANSYITKPLTFSEFTQKIDELKIYWGGTNSLP